MSWGHWGKGVWWRVRAQIFYFLWIRREISQTNKHGRGNAIQKLGVRWPDGGNGIVQPWRGKWSCVTLFGVKGLRFVTARESVVAQSLRAPSWQTPAVFAFFPFQISQLHEKLHALGGVPNGKPCPFFLKYYLFASPKHNVESKT